MRSHMAGHDPDAVTQCGHTWLDMNLMRSHNVVTGWAGLGWAAPLGWAGLGGAGLGWVAEIRTYLI